MDIKELSSILNELGKDSENYYNAVAPPIIQTSNFSFGKVDEMRRAFAAECSTFVYSCGLNPSLLKHGIITLP